MSLVLDGTEGLTYNDGTLQASAPVGKNRIINGAMRIDQRNAGASVTPANSYTLDRWQGAVSQTGKFTVQQNAGSVTPPAGYKNYLGVTSSSAYSVLTGDYFMLSQRIEGYNFADFNFGSADAQTLTFSFWVRSSLTGTFGGSLQGAAAATLRSYPFTYTIGSANTWEQKTITIAGDTYSNTWDSTNGVGLYVNVGLGAGGSASGSAGSWASANYANATSAVSVVGTSGATFYITGVQLEKSSTATEFEYRPYGAELALCQRYARPLAANDCIGQATSATAAWFFSTGITMRAVPTLSLASGAVAVTASGAVTAITALLVNSGGATNGTVLLNTTTTSGLVAGHATFLAGTARLLVAEL
jgi:hypothetical protein